MSKDTIKKVRRQSKYWEKIFGNHIPDKDLISRIYREFVKFNNEKINDQFKNGKSIFGRTNGQKEHGEDVNCH